MLYKQTFLIGSALLVLICGCTIPEAPSRVSWDTEFSVPIAEHTYGLWEIADGASLPEGETSGITMINSDSALFFSYRQIFDPIHPGDEINFEQIEYDIETELEGLRIAAGVDQFGALTLRDLNPNLANRHGTQTEIPAFEFQALLPYPADGPFDLACVMAGIAEVTVSSDLDFDIQVLDAEWITHRNNPVTMFTGQASAQSEMTIPSSLCGHCLSDEMSLSITGSVSGGEFVTVDSCATLSFGIEVNEIVTEQYKGPMQRQIAAADSVWELEQRHRLYEGIVSEGNLRISSTNHMSVGDSVRIVLPDVRTPEGETMIVEYYVEAGESVERSIPLENYRLIFEDAVPQEISARMEAIIPETDNAVSFSAGDQRVRSRFWTEGVSFRYFDGYLVEHESEIEADSTEVEDIPDGWENIHPVNVDAYLRIRGGFPAQGTFAVTLESVRDEGVLGNELLTSRVSLARDTTLLFTDLAGLVPSIPDWIRYSGTVILDGRTIVYDTNSVGGELELKAPLSFTIDPTVIEEDVQSVDPEPIEDIIEMELDFRIWNALPVSGSIALVASRDSTALTQSSTVPAETLGVVALPPALIQGERVAAPGYSESRLLLPDLTYDLLANPPFYVRSALTLEGSAGDTLVAYGSDYVQYSATARVRYRVSMGDE